MHLTNHDIFQLQRLNEQVRGICQLKDKIIIVRETERLKHLLEANKRIFDRYQFSLLQQQAQMLRSQISPLLSDSLKNRLECARTVGDSANLIRFQHVASQWENLFGFRSHDLNKLQQQLLHESYRAWNSSLSRISSSILMANKYENVVVLFRKLVDPYKIYTDFVSKSIVDLSRFNDSRLERATQAALRIINWDLNMGSQMLRHASNYIVEAQEDSDESIYSDIHYWNPEDIKRALQNALRPGTWTSRQIAKVFKP